MPIQIAVCGPADCTPSERAAAHQVGRLLGEAGATVLCGGGGGVMAAVTAGAREVGGLVIAVRPDSTRGPGSPGAAHNPAGPNAVIRTGMGEARNAILIRSADAVIVVGGSWGTLSELAHARRTGVPVVSIGGWRVFDHDGTPVDVGAVAGSPVQAVQRALTAAL